MQYNIYTDNLKTAVFDIETAGLSFQKDIIISASFCDEDGSNLRQYFCDDPDSEYLLITKIYEEFDSLDALITYNGQRFDVPYVLNRAKKHGISNVYPFIWNIDIYRILKKYWQAGQLLPSLSQSSVEDALGIKANRTDTIDGGECIPLYNMYLAKHDEEAKRKILLHNGDDVRQLARISQSLSFIPFHKVAYETGYPVKVLSPDVNSNDITVYIGPVSEYSDQFSVNAKTFPGLLPMSIFEEYYSLEYDSFTGAAKLILFPKQLEDYLYLDLTQLPVDIDLFKGLDGFASNYLIIKQNNNILYKELNKIVSELLKKIVYF